MLEFMEYREGNVLPMKAAGELTRGDHLQFLTQLESLAREGGKVRVLCELKNVKGLETDSGWEDPIFALRDKALVKRFAIIGQKKYRRWMRPLAEPFTEVKFFTPHQREEAWRWVCEGALEEAERERISRLAYAKWEAAGRPCGDDVRFWLEAERELHQAG
jgi:hypothetical protein